MKTKLTDKVGNDEILTSIEEIKLPNVMSKRKAFWLGPILRRHCLQLRIIERKVEGERGRGRR